MCDVWFALSNRLANVIEAHLAGHNFVILDFCSQHRETSSPHFIDGGFSIIKSRLEGHKA